MQNNIPHYQCRLTEFDCKIFLVPFDCISVFIHVGKLPMLVLGQIMTGGYFSTSKYDFGHYSTGVMSRLHMSKMLQKLTHLMMTGTAPTACGF